jgi:hypothetical protein
MLRPSRASQRVCKVTATLLAGQAGMALGSATKKVKVQNATPEIVSGHFDFGALHSAGKRKT